jgi:uncharacterized MAPEG superfamily protein
MTTPFWCLVIVAVIPYVLAGAGGYFKTRQFGKPDNNEPRAQAAQLEGAGARAGAAQHNAWEALALFTPAVILAHLAGADPGMSATASLLFLAARVVHPVLYIAGQATLRSLVFVVGFGSAIWLFSLAASA